MKEIQTLSLLFLTHFLVQSLHLALQLLLLLLGLDLCLSQNRFQLLIALNQTLVLLLQFLQLVKELGIPALNALHGFQAPAHQNPASPRLELHPNCSPPARKSQGFPHTLLLISSLTSSMACACPYLDGNSFIIPRVGSTQGMMKVWAGNRSGRRLPTAEREQQIQLLEVENRLGNLKGEGSEGFLKRISSPFLPEPARRGAAPPEQVLGEQSFEFHQKSLFIYYG